MSEVAETSAITDLTESQPLSPAEKWCSLPARLSSLAGSVTLQTKQTRLWALTLEARQLPADGDGWQLLVPPEAFTTALEELRQFETENGNWPPPLPSPSPQNDNLLITVSVLFLLAIFHNLTRLNLDSVSASTTVFGAVGLLAAINLFRRRQPLRRRWYLPLAAALALLALLGSEGENTDLGAHLFGFAVGIGLGLATGYLLGRNGRPAPRFNALLVLACLGLVIGAWWAALRFS